jgi:hypothetical protein
MRPLCARTSLSGLAISTRDLSTSTSAFTSIENESASAGVSRPKGERIAARRRQCFRASFERLRATRTDFTAWCMECYFSHGSSFFLIQSRLIATGNIALHRRVGVAAGFILALIIPVAYATCVAMVRRKLDLIQYGAELAKLAVAA